MASWSIFEGRCVQVTACRKRKTLASFSQDILLKNKPVLDCYAFRRGRIRGGIRPAPFSTCTKCNCVVVRESVHSAPAHSRRFLLFSRPNIHLLQVDDGMTLRGLKKVIS